MLSTVISVGSAVVLIAGAIYVFYEYFPIIVNFFNSAIDQFYIVSESLPDWLAPVVSIGVLLSAVGLLVKIL